MGSIRLKHLKLLGIIQSSCVKDRKSRHLFLSFWDSPSVLSLVFYILRIFYQKEATPLPYSLISLRVIVGSVILTARRNFIYTELLVEN
jgi:hypothetical protein